jgi:Ca-activated chloride channel family protein
MEMTRFENITYLYALLGLIPLTGIFIFYHYWRRRTYQKLGELQLIEQLAPENSKRKHIIKFILIFFAFIFLVIGIANPQIGTKFEKVKRSGVDVMIALDVSKSMLAEDIKPDRLERSKQFISRLIDKLQNDRIGLIVFAGNAYLQMPITIDYSAAKLFLNNINTEMVPTQGTAIAEAIELSMQSFNKEEKKFKTLIIITDGEDHEGDALTLAEEAAAEGVIVHTIGVGSPKGAPIPQYRNSVQSDFKRDENGNIVLSKLNETELQQIAAKGDGKYYRLSSGTQEIDAIISEISTMEKKNFEERVFTDYEDQFQYFLAVAFILITLEFFISDKKSVWLRKLGIFKSSAK